MEGSSVLNIGSRRELFVDHYLIGKLTNTTLKLHEPRNEGVALQMDKLWEAPYPDYVSVVKDGDLYRMWFRGRYGESGGGGPTASVCYAASDDGISWSRPDLGLVEIQGSKDNNAIMTEQYSGNFSVFIDEKPGVLASERYKAFAGGPPTAFVSGDGIHWEKLRDEPVLSHGERWRTEGDKPVIPGDGPAWDSQNVAFWSEAEGCYVGYFRTYKPMGATWDESRENYRKRHGVDGHGWRSIARATSDDFVNWTGLQEMDFGDTAQEHMYTNGTLPYFRAPHIYVALVKRLLPNKMAVADDEAAALAHDPGHRMHSSHAVFMTSRGGNRFDRTFMEAFLRPGPTPADWVSYSNTPAPGVLPGGERDMYIYRIAHYGQPTVHLRRYSLRLDGFVSVNAPYAGGELLTKPFTFTGSELELNYETSAFGGVRVEVQDESRRAIPGYALDDCPEFFGDRRIEGVVSWEKGADVSALEGRAVRLRFELKDADVYSFRFR